MYFLVRLLIYFFTSQFRTEIVWNFLFLECFQDYYFLHIFKIFFFSVNVCISKFRWPIYTDSSRSEDSSETEPFVKRTFFFLVILYVFIYPYLYILDNCAILSLHDGRDLLCHTAWLIGHPWCSVAGDIELRQKLET